MQYTEYLEGFRAHARLGRLTEYGAVVEEDVTYPLLRLSTDGEKKLVITAGFHGEEQAGPLTLLERLPEIAAYAAEKGVGLEVFPCVNPSGFEAHTRYNRSGERPNNDFLRYEVRKGEWKGELNPGEPFLSYRLFDGGPKETKALRGALEKLPAPDAALDLHQDAWLAGAFAYAYVFGDHRLFLPLVEASAKFMGIARGYAVDEQKNRVGDDGLIDLNDGSVTDYYMRRGVRFTACLETTTQAPMADCHEVNLVWIRGFVDFAATR